MALGQLSAECIQLEGEEVDGLGLAVIQQLGTRHRAALGITEQTDCVVIMVSEETSEISVACDGRFIPIVNRERLVNILKDALKDSRQGRRYLPTGSGREISRAEIYGAVLNEARVSLQRGVEFVMALPASAAVMVTGAPADFAMRSSRLVPPASSAPPDSSTPSSLRSR